MLDSGKLLSIAGDDELGDSQADTFVSAHGISGLRSRTVSHEDDHYLPARDKIRTDVCCHRERLIVLMRDKEDNCS
jgi:hypothetical protein